MRSGAYKIAQAIRKNKQANKVTNGPKINKKKKILADGLIQPQVSCEAG